MTKKLLILPLPYRQKEDCSITPGVKMRRFFTKSADRAFFVAGKANSPLG